MIERVIRSLLALVFLLPLTTALTPRALAQTVPTRRERKGKGEEEPVEVRVLLRTRAFAGAHTGYSGGACPAVTALRIVLTRPAPEAQRVCLDLLERAEIGGKLYALCGLYVLDRARFHERVLPFLQDERVIDVYPGGCMGIEQRVCDLVRAPKPNRADFLGGAFPLEVAKHKGFLVPREPQGTVQEWLARLDAPDADPEEIASGLASFGRPGLQAALTSSQDPRPLARRMAVSVVFFFGSEELGPHCDEAATLLGPLLLDPDPTVAREAAEALYALAPFHRAGLPWALRALEDAPRRLGAYLRSKAERAKVTKESAEGQEADDADEGEGEEDDAEDEAPELELARSLIGAFGANEAAIPSLLRLLEVESPSIRCAAGCELAELGSRAAPARERLSQLMGGDRVPCALEALVRIGIDPDSPQLARTLALLQDPERADLAAEILGDLGSRAPGRVAPALVDAMARYDTEDPGTAAEVAIAHWRITGKTERMIERLLRGDRDLLALDLIEKDSGLLAEVAPRLADSHTRRGALNLLIRLGARAKPLEAPLRKACEPLEPGQRLARRAAVALHEVTEDASLVLRVAAHDLASEHETARERGYDLACYLGPKGLPLRTTLLAHLEALPVNDHEPWLLYEALVGLGPKAEVQAALLFEARARRGSLKAPLALERLARTGRAPAALALERLGRPEVPKPVRERALKALEDAKVPATPSRRRRWEAVFRSGLDR